MGVMDRLLTVLEEKKLSIKQFSTMMGYETTSRVSNWKLREAMPLRACPKAAQILGVSTEWLLTGEGEREPTSDDMSLDASMQAFFSKDDIGHLPARKLKALADAHIEIPIYDVRASAGLGAFVEREETTGALTVAKAWARQNIGYVEGVLNMIYVEGDSMQPTLDNGDMIIIDRTPIQANDFSDGIHVIRLGQKIMVKRLQIMPHDTIMALSDNPLYQPFQLDENADFDILGKVKWIWKGVRVS